ncbi:MAG TPA: transporter substrate-binding domain-containing protein [Luteimonas sp.]|nr:transporter substrate-binding domain-containing protein [Luteimonas sp.]
MSRTLRVVLLAACCTLSACGDYPRDAEHSLQRVRGSALRVGVSHEPPYVVLAAGAQPSGSEVDLVRALARTQGARIEWVPGGHDALMGDLLAFRLQLVVGGHSEQSPWQSQVAWSRPYLLADSVGGSARRRLALPPGENAWQLVVDRYVLRSERALAAQAADRRP